MAKVIFDGLTKEQAKQLANWYEGQGEQDASVWFECQDNPVEVPLVRSIKTNKKTGDVSVECYTTETEKEEKEE